VFLEDIFLKLNGKPSACLFSSEKQDLWPKTPLEINAGCWTGLFDNGKKAVL